MRLWITLLASLAVFSASRADTPPPPLNDPDIHLPDVNPVAPPSPPVPTPSEPQKLTTDLLYVIDSKVPVVVLCSPSGVVSVTEESGPIKLRGKFVGGTGKVETKTFKGPHVYTVEPVLTARCELIIVPVGLTDVTKIVRRTVDVDSGQAPQPPPTPPGPNPPGPNPPGPSPLPDAGFRVLITYESADLSKLPAGQVAALYSGDVRAYLNSKAVKGPDGKTAEWRVWDQNSNVANESDVWKRAFARPRQSVPWVMISTGTNGYEGPLPSNVNDLLTLLKKYGG